jgi:hypothetical protein
VLEASRDDEGGMTMSLLWVLILIIILAALFGGFAVNDWLFLLLIIALIVALVNYL